MTQTENSDGALQQLFDKLRNAPDDRVISVGHIINTIGTRGFGALLVVPALFAISPIAAIPGVPTLLAVMIGLIAAQILVGKRGLWVPETVRTRQVPSERVETALSRLQPLAKVLDRYLARRLTWAAGTTATRIAAGVVIVLCLMVPVLELLPGAVVAPMTAIALVGLAMMVRDGIIMLTGLAAAVAAAALSLGVVL